jgi:hypothetical protein
MMSSSTPAGDNGNAVQAIANVVKSSLGPVGLDKVGQEIHCSSERRMNATNGSEIDSTKNLGDQCLECRCW